VRFRAPLQSQRYGGFWCRAKESFNECTLSVEKHLKMTGIVGDDQLLDPNKNAV
jgi:hypothetical protein